MLLEHSRSSWMIEVLRRFCGNANYYFSRPFEVSDKQPGIYFQNFVPTEPNQDSGTQSCVKAGFQFSPPFPHHAHRAKTHGPFNATFGLKKIDNNVASFNILALIYLYVPVGVFSEADSSWLTARLSTYNH